MIDRIKYWAELADYDYDTAKTLLAAGRYLYVGFMCHQTIEKMLKAYWSSVSDEPPLKVHHLSRLAAKSGLIENMSEEQLQFIDMLEPLNIEARYPSYKEQLMRALSRDNCTRLLADTNNLRQWIRHKLSR